MRCENHEYCIKNNMFARMKWKSCKKVEKTKKNSCHFHRNTLRW
ncbi:hypothetical protein CLOHYLEM_04403 [[Clostridium] hylemonae DSM 15053]|uniref:Uncharacterized protein n=1 Tax=[Clostridium] hylemonae DSM 15053 TaxID=553973 RepID=C0BX66_9FIRM|nr:hypothetical protein CLOHYLEM_04403 [[Clostridium] hylemonae DSM 15053]